MGGAAWYGVGVGQGIFFTVDFKFSLFFTTKLLLKKICINLDVLISMIESMIDLVPQGVYLRECLIAPATCCPATCILVGRHKNSDSVISAY